MIDLLNKLFSQKTCPIKVGDRFVDKDWGDTVIEIVKINAKNNKCRYKFITIYGKSINSSSVFCMAKWYLLEKYNKTSELL